ncbi:MAG: YceI family protein [Niastella sp.]|nr:YceI family protein [Niastella sp.]
MERSPAYKKTIAFGLVCYSLLLTVSTSAQIKYQSAGVKITVEGTSNIHDWNMKSEKGTCSGVFDLSSTGTVTGLESLNFSVPAESLKSEKSGLDKNSYKALNTSKYNLISFASGQVTVKPAAGTAHTVVTNGKLTIAGVTKDVQFTANGVVNPDKSITYTGSYQLKMTDFNVEPPSLMFGAIKTANVVTVKFNLVLKAANNLTSL